MSSQEFRPYVVCIVHLNSYVRFQKLNVRMYEVSRTNLLVLGPYYHLLFSRKKHLLHILTAYTHIGFLKLHFKFLNFIKLGFA